MFPVIRSPQEDVGRVSRMVAEVISFQPFCPERALDSSVKSQERRGRQLAKAVRPMSRHFPALVAHAGIDFREIGAKIFA